jgi:hypothetical protein
MKSSQFGLLDLLLLVTAAPLWFTLIVGISGRFGDKWAGYLFVTMCLAGISFALHRLVRLFSSRWSWSVLLSPIVAILALMLAKSLAGREFE